MSSSAVARESCKHVIFASTAAVYAPTDDPCVEDTTPLGPLEVYGESKLAAENGRDAFHAETGIPTTTLRLFNGIGRNETNPHVVPHIFESLQTSDVIRLGNIAPRRDYIDTRDIAEAILSVAADRRATGCSTSALASPTSVQRHPGSARTHPRPRASRWCRTPHGSGPTERMVLAADIEKIRRETTWTPRLSLEDTLRDLVAAYGLQTKRYPTV